MNNKTAPIISVCIPTYNNAKNLKKVIDSVLNQNNVDYELIVSDDSTTLDVKELINNYISRGYEIQYTHNHPSLGSPKNWNNAIKLANGKYIKILHHDDWLQGDLALFEMLEIVKDHENAFAFTAADSIQFGKKIEHIPSENINIEFNSNPLKLLTGNMIGGPSAVLFPKNAGIEFDERLIWLVDVDFYLNLYLNGFKSYYSTQKLYCTFMDENNITNKCIYDRSLNLRELSIIYRKYTQLLSFKQKILMTYYMYKYLRQHFKITYLKTVISILKFK